MALIDITDYDKLNKFIENFPGIRVCILGEIRHTICELALDDMAVKVADPKSSALYQFAVELFNAGAIDEHQLAHLVVKHRTSNGILPLVEE